MKAEIIPQSKANELYAVEQELEALESRLKREIAPLKQRSEELRASLLKSMIGAGIKAIRTDEGTSYMRTPSTKFEVVDEEIAYKWGEQHNCLRLDKVGARSILVRECTVNDSGEIIAPNGWQRIDSEFITIKRAKLDNKEHEE